MSRSFFFHLIFLFGFILSGFGQEKKEPKPQPNEPLQDSVEKYNNLGQYAEAVPFAEKWVEKTKKEKGDESAEYGTALHTLGRSLILLGKYNEAEIILIQAIEVRKRALDEQHPDVAKSLSNLGAVYEYIGNYPKAEEFYLKALVIWKKAYGEEHPDVAVSLNNLGAVYLYMGNYPKAEEFYLKVLIILKKAKGEEHPDVATSLNNLGILYWYMGNYPNAEEFYLKALAIWKKALGEEHPDLAISLLNLGIIYYNMGNYPKAEEFQLKALIILKKAKGEEHPVVAQSFANLGNVYLAMVNFPKAEEFFLKALAINKKAIGEEHPDMALSLAGLGGIYFFMSSYLKSEEFYLKTLAIQKKALGEEHPDVAIVLLNLGNLHLCMGNYPKAQAFIVKSLEIYKKTFGTNHPNIQTCFQGLAQYYRQKNQFVLAEENYGKSWDHLAHQIQNYFPFLSDAEKAKFYENVSQPIEEIKSFYLLPKVKTPKKTGQIYNQQLFTKALLLSTSARRKQRVKTSGDKKLWNLFSQWEMTQNQISKLHKETDSTMRSGLDSTLAKSEILEKELSKRSEAYGKMTDRKLVTWQEVQARLKLGQAAIEMLRIKKWGIQKVVTDTSDSKKLVYKVQGLTDTIQYAALIVKHGLLQPELVMLPLGNDMEGKRLNYYKAGIKNKYTDEKSYNVYWKKIAEKLGHGVKTIYFSPEGVYHGINLNTLWNPVTNKYLLDEMDIRLVTSTKDLLLSNNTEEMNQLAYLFGYPNYNTGLAERKVIASERSSPELSYSLPKTRGESFAELPGTKVEVESIATLLSEKGWEVKTLQGDKALEETLKESYKPRVLHLATHGFFFPDTTKGNNPLLHSGLH